MQRIFGLGVLRAARHLRTRRLHGVPGARVPQTKAQQAQTVPLTVGRETKLIPHSLRGLKISCVEESTCPCPRHVVT
jgi:hypothetical protein